MNRLLMVGLLFAAFCSAAVFDFETTPGAVTPFSATSSGLTATFSSPGGAVFFAVTPFFPLGIGLATLSGNVLLHPINADPLTNELDVVFSSPIQFLTLNFATTAIPTDTLSLTALTGGLGGMVVGSATVMGSIPPGLLFPEGVLTFSGPSFDAVSLTSTLGQFNFFLDNLNTTAILEPSTMMLSIAGLTVLAYRRREQTNARIQPSNGTPKAPHSANCALS